jgi:hypothetical protein
VRVMPVPPNKGMKLTRPEHIGASQLIPGVRWASGTWRQPDKQIAAYPQCWSDLGWAGLAGSARSG